MRRLPPIVWVLVSIASLLILRGSGGHWRPGLLAAGIALALIAFGLGLYLALAESHERPKPRWVNWAIAGAGIWYLAMAVLAGQAGPAYMVAGLAASVIPLTALCLIVATARAKTVGQGDRLADATKEADDDPYPGLGFEGDVPLGDTSELSDAPRDQGVVPGRRFQRTDEENRRDPDEQERQRRVAEREAARSSPSRTR